MPIVSLHPAVPSFSLPHLQLLLLLLSHFSRVRLCATSLMAAHQAPMSLGFSRQKYWSGLPFPSPMHACMLSCFSHVLLCATPWTTAHQAPLSTGFSRQEYWSGLPFPSPHTQLVNIYWAPHTGQHCSRNRGDCAGQKKKKKKTDKISGFRAFTVQWGEAERN